MKGVWVHKVNPAFPNLAWSVFTLKRRSLQHLANQKHEQDYQQQSGQFLKRTSNSIIRNNKLWTISSMWLCCAQMKVFLQR